MIISCAIYIVVYFLNKSLLISFVLNQALQTLQQRFMIWSNMRTTKWLGLITALDFLFNSFALVLSNIGRIYFRNGLTSSYVVFMAIFYNLFALEALLFPFVTIRWEVFNCKLNYLQKIAQFYSDILDSILNYAI